MSDLILEPLTARHIDRVAELHVRAFPGFFLSQLGVPFLTEFYRGFIMDPTAITVVALDPATRTPLGCVVGTTQPGGFFRRLLQRRFLGFGLASLGYVAKNPKAAPRLVRAVVYRGDSPTGVDAQALLSSICVDPAAGGSGVGRRLVREWERRLLANGVGTAYLTTDAAGNDRVNAFYQGLGWTLLDSYTTKEGRAMNRYVRDLVGDAA